MNLKEILEINPVLLTQGVAAFVAVCGALGVKELLKMAYERWCKKADEEDLDHKLIIEMNATLDDIKEQLKVMEKNDKQSLENDILMLEHNILFLQRKAITYGKVSRGCLPRYRLLYKRYKLLIERANFEVNEEVESNNELVEKMFQAGEVVNNFWEMYKNGKEA